MTLKPCGPTMQWCSKNFGLITAAKYYPSFRFPKSIVLLLTKLNSKPKPREPLGHLQTRSWVKYTEKLEPCISQCHINEMERCSSSAEFCIMYISLSIRQARQALSNTRVLTQVTNYEINFLSKGHST